MEVFKGVALLPPDTKIPRSLYKDHSATSVSLNLNKAFMVLVLKYFGPDFKKQPSSHLSKLHPQCKPVPV